MNRKMMQKEDVALLVNEFYRSVKKDPVIGYIFEDIEHFDWDVHIPIMISFWQTVLFHEGNYKGNPVRTHVDLNKHFPLTEEHFIRWKKLFFATLDTYFEGPKVDEAKKRVEAMEILLLYKIKESQKPGFIQ